VASLRMRRALVAKYPESSSARFSLARQLLRSGDADGVPLMETLIQKETQAFKAGAELLRSYYERRHEHDLAIHWHRKLTEAASRCGKNH
jgi:hypothetical protein